MRRSRRRYVKARTLRYSTLVWWQSNRRSFPWRSASDPFHILLAEFLLQKTPAWKVTPAYQEIVRRWPSPSALVTVPHGELYEVVRPLGLVARVERLQRLAAAVVAAGGVPKEESALLALPGVGEYMARAVRCFAFEEAEPLVDSVSGRVFRRFFGLSDHGEPGRDPAVWKLARAVAGKSDTKEINWAILDFAATVCKPKKPHCWECPLVRHCRWAAENYWPQERKRRGAHIQPTRRIVRRGAAPTL